MKNRYRILAPLILIIIVSLTFSCKTAVPTGETVPLKKIETGKKILVVYFSKTGNTERVARDISSSMNADIEKIIDKKERTGCIGWFASGSDGMNEELTDIEPVKKNPRDYDIVIIGSPVWGWNMTPAVRTYVEQNRENFKDVAFFITAGGTKAEEITPFFEKLSGKKALISLGLIEDELKTPDVYNRKLNEFIVFFMKK